MNIIAAEIAGYDLAKINLTLTLLVAMPARSYPASMPSRNVYKISIGEAYYHVYSRGVNKRPIFLDEQDYSTFLNLLKRYLSTDRSRDKFGRTYANLSGRIELLTYCLMPNHFHLLVYQHTPEALQQLMQRVIGSYSVYFNDKHARVGPLFQSRYKASLIQNETYLEHISRYIHLNPAAWRHYRYSSLPYYNSQFSADWIRPARILRIFHNNFSEYLTFLEAYDIHKLSQQQAERLLANK